MDVEESTDRANNTDAALTAASGAVLEDVINKGDCSSGGKPLWLVIKATTPLKVLKDPLANEGGRSGRDEQHIGVNRHYIS